MSNKNKPSVQSGHPLTSGEQQLVSDIRDLIDSARQRIAVAVNADLSLLYLQVGGRINRIMMNGSVRHGRRL